MSTVPDNEFDLEKLFLPSWAQEPASAKSYAHYEGEERHERREGRRGPRGPRPEGQRGPRPEGPRGPRRDDRRPGGGMRGPRPDRGGRFEGRGPRGGQAPERREPPPPLPQIDVALTPDEKGVESLARQIRMTGRAYPLFEIAQMILQKPERHAVSFTVKKDGEGKVIEPLFLCALDDTLWLSEDEAVAHVLRKHFATFYQAERTATEPPKGKYTFVAQCGMSGVILGPPNLHDYQNQLRKLHADRYSRMPFEVYKSRVRIVRDEEVVKKWVEDQSWKTEYIVLNVPEPLRLMTMEEVEKHFRETHKDTIIKQVEAHTMSGTAARNLRSAPLTRLVRQVWEDQKRFPLQIATVLSQQFASHGLQFFKVNKTYTHVSVARPHYLDMDATPVSIGVRNIVEYINTHPKTTRRQLVEALAPSATVIPVMPSAPVAAPPAAPAAAPEQPVASPEPAAPAEPGAVAEAKAEAAPAAQPAPPAAAAPAGPTPEQTAVIADLHWLIHQGHVIEFANGVLETAKKPVPKPPKPAKPEPKPAEVAAAATTEAAAQSAEGTDASVATSETAPATLGGGPPASGADAGTQTPGGEVEVEIQPVSLSEGAAQALPGIEAPAAEAAPEVQSPVIASEPEPVSAPPASAEPETKREPGS